MYKSLIHITLYAILITNAACSGDDKEDEANPEETASSAIGSENESGEGDSEGDPSGGEKPASCGNNVVEEASHEECDDGNDNDEDGCTRLCAYTCKEDDDCDDLDPCNGTEMCLDDHTCSSGTEEMSDGELCGDNASCNDGECVVHICGNEIVQGDEECDDGDDDDKNGCTKECLFTCVVSREAQATVVNDCNPNAVCNETAHKWEGGDPLPDGTLCHRGEGYCDGGVCVLANCGDGVQEPNEDCDLGDQNGQEGSGCTANCRETVCGNGVIEGKEYCDDGNNVNLDGCDYNCVPEVTFRGSTMQVSMDPAPDYCIYAGNERDGNAFGKLFTSQLLLDLVNGILQGMFDEGEVHALFHVMDMEGYEPTKPDPLARLGLSLGEPLQDWLSSPVKLDLEFNAYREFFNDNLEPLTTVSGEMIMEGDVQVVMSTAPAVAGFLILGTEYVLHDMMARIETDGNFTPLPPPPEVIEDLVIHSSVGAHGTGVPTGVLCGALHENAFASMPLPPELLVLCIDQLLEGTYTPCEEGMDFQGGECDSVLTLFQGGCTDLGVPLLNPLRDPDVDTDGDGTNDAYTAVLRVSAERVKVVGVMDMPEDMADTMAE